MKVQLLIDGTPAELIRVLQLVADRVETTDGSPDVTLYPSVAADGSNEKPEPAEKTKRKKATSDASQTPKPLNDAPATDAKPEAAKPEAAKPEAPRRVDLETVRDAFSPRFMQKKEEVMGLLKSYGHDKLSRFWEAATDAQKAEFYSKLFSITVTV